VTVVQVAFSVMQIKTLKRSQRQQSALNLYSTIS